MLGRLELVRKFFRRSRRRRLLGAALGPGPGSEAHHKGAATIRERGRRERLLNLDIGVIGVF